MTGKDKVRRSLRKTRTKEFYYHLPAELSDVLDVLFPDSCPVAVVVVVVVSSGH
jgi:hypothetical protein